MTGVNAVGNGNSLEMVQKNMLGKDEFLKMLLAQLKHQDPLNPMDGTDFTAQLAQFSSLEQLSNVNNNLEALSAGQMLSNMAQAVSLIGKEIVAMGNTVEVRGAPVEIAYRLSEDAHEGEVNIYRSDGSLVKTLEFGNQKAGNSSVAWDCSGVEEGIYTFHVSATNDGGAPVRVDTLIKGQATGVNFQDDRFCILVGDLEVPFENVTHVKSSGT